VHGRGQDHPELTTALAELLPVDHCGDLHLEPVVDPVHNGVESDRHDLARPFEAAFDVELPLVLMCAGIAFRQWAVAVLGPFFTVDVRVQRGQTVVDRGPYRWVRHPSYTGLIAIFVGLGLALDNWAALAVLAVVPTVGLLVRIRFEERALLEGLGEQYRRFAAGRRRLFPGVW